MKTTPRRTVRRAVRAGDQLRMKLSVARQELRVCPCWRLAEIAKWEARVTDLSSRLCLVDSIATLNERV